MQASIIRNLLQKVMFTKTLSYWQWAVITVVTKLSFSLSDLSYVHMRGMDGGGEVEGEVFWWRAGAGNRYLLPKASFLVL